MIVEQDDIRFSRIEQMRQERRSFCELPQPPFTGEAREGARVFMALESFARHMSDEGWQLQTGLEAAGYELWGRHFPGIRDCIDTREIVQRTNPATVIVQDKREWDPAQEGCFDKSAAFHAIQRLADRPDIFRLAVIKDAHQFPGYHRDWHASIQPHVWIHYYHPSIVQTLCPWIRPTDMIRAWHSVDAGRVPAYRAERIDRALLSGAIDGMGTYALRRRIRTAINRGTLPEAIYAPHPGYGANGTHTPRFLRTISAYKVLIATTSVFAYALRKIVEGVACGCVVITDLPRGDRMPEIDEALVRVPYTVEIPVLRDRIREAIVRYDPERQEHYARLACRHYDFWRLGRQLADQIDTLRRAPCPTLPA